MTTKANLFSAAIAYQHATTLPPPAPDPSNPGGPPPRNYPLITAENTLVAAAVAYAANPNG